MEAARLSNGTNGCTRLYYSPAHKGLCRVSTGNEREGDVTKCSPQ